jgi:hypothetical protein
MAPRMKHARTFVFASAISGLAASLILHGCEGSATQTTTEQGLHGTLVDIHGHPVPGAEIKAWPAASGPNGLPNRPDSLNASLAETDAEGRYSLSGLEAGVYNLYGESKQGDAAVLIPRVKYLESAIDLGTDTLAPSGSITGKVLYEGSPVTPAFCYLQGSTFVGLTDSSGAFTLDRIPAGTYRLNYVAQGFASDVDSPVVVLPGQSIALPTKNLGLDLDAQPPAPHIVSATYDTVQGITRIVWNRSKASDVQMYSVESYTLGQDTQFIAHRIAPHSNFQDTVFTDSNGRLFGSGFSSDADPDELEEFTVVYRIRSVDRDGMVSRPGKDTILIKVTRPEILKYSISLRLAEGDKDTVLCQDSLVFILSLDQPAKGPVDAVYWMIAWRPNGIAASGPLAPHRPLHLLPDTTVWRLDSVAFFDIVPSEMDSIQVLAQTSLGNDTFGQGKDAIGDERRMMVRKKPNGCFEVEKSHPPSIVIDADGNHWVE